MTIEDVGGEEDTVVEVVTDDTPQVETQVEDQSGSPEGDDPAAGIEALRRQIADFEARAKTQQQDLEASRRAAADARVAREEAERRAEKARRDAAGVEREARDSRYSSVVNALAAAEGQLAQQQAAYEAAGIENDWKKAAQIAADIGRTAARVSQLEAGKLEFESQRSTERPVDQREPESISDQEETFIRRLPPRSAAWVREHRDRYFGDAAFQNMVAGAHQLATGRGIAQDSDAYFKFIEEECGIRSREAALEEHREAPAAEVVPKAAPTSTAAATAARRSPTPSAPAASGAPTSARSSGSPTTAVELNAEEREFCRVNEIPEANYAKQKKQLMDEKRLGPTAIH